LERLARFVYIKEFAKRLFFKIRDAFFEFAKPKYQPAFSLPFVFLLASKGRQNRPADAASPKKKNPSVAPAKLALYELGLASQVQGYAPFFLPLDLMWLEQLRPRHYRIFLFSFGTAHLLRPG
jgi:hypothetical protein